MIHWLIILTIILTIIGIIIIYFDWDRTIRLSFSPISSLSQNYSQRPKSNRRTVAILNCDNGVCDKTIKSILDQSIRLHDIAVQTSNPHKINPDLLSTVSIHKPRTEIVREMDRDTLILNLENGKEYPFNYVEDQIKANLERTKT